MGLADRWEELDDLIRRNHVVDVVVIGSGYGAGVCAARLAEAGAGVVVLERGREFTTGEFPSKLHDIVRNIQLDNAWIGRSHRLGLFNCYVGADLDVVVGCGLGGTSLINAGVMLRPDPRVFERRAWPAVLRDEAADGTLDRYYHRVRAVLQPAAYPEARRTPRKLAAMLAAGARRCEVAVHFEAAPVNSVGVAQRSCISCGDCLTGCNHHAKKTLCFTYLPIAKSYGARIHVQCDVQHLARRDGLWDVHVQHVVRGDEPIRPTHRLRARTVIVAAGVMGTTAILLRSQRLGLALAGSLGTRFSGNGDAIAFAYDCVERMDSVATARRTRRHPTGPAILGVVDRRAGALDRGVIVEDGVFPSGAAAVLRAALGGLAAGGAPAPGGAAGWLRTWRDRLCDLLGVRVGDGALNRTLAFLSMGHDGADGTVELDVRGRSRIRWPELHARRVFAAEDALTREITGELGGEFLRDPVDRRLFMNNLTTVHPLGGCAMGDGDAAVDHAGRVRDAGGAVHPGLYVADASVIPTSLGVNPLWTIAALAERIAAHAVVELGLAPTLDAVCASSTLRPGTWVSP